MNIERNIITARLVTLFATTLLVGAAGCENTEQAGTTVEDVKDWPSAYMGKVVTLVGEVEEQYASGSFRINGKGTWWDDEILVVLPREQVTTLALTEDSDVRVTGEIAQFVVADLERDYGIDFANEVEVEFRDKPVVIARSVDVIAAD